MKECKECKETKPLEEFYKKGSCLLGRTPCCKACIVAKAKANYKPRPRTWKSKNEFTVKGDILEIHMKYGKVTIVDAKHLEKVKPYSWYVSAKGYAIARARIPILGYENGVNIKLHRLILNAEKGTVSDIDHIDHNTLNNLESNLRICSRAENSRNKRILDANTSGIAGVGWNVRSNKWKATIYINNNEIHLGYFENKEDAIKARKEAEIEHFGEYAFNTSIKK